jgi:hypothetical protein
VTMIRIARLVLLAIEWKYCGTRAGEPALRRCAGSCGEFDENTRISPCSLRSRVGMATRTDS